MGMVATERNGSTTVFGKHGALHVEGSKLKDSNNQNVQLRGISTHNIAIYPEYINKELITQFVDEYGITVFRLAMYTGEADGFPGYANETPENKIKLEELMMKGVKLCAELGIYCLVDWHILFDYNPKMYMKEAVTFWKKMCPLLSEYDNVIYEICNEPNMNLNTMDNACPWDDIYEFAETIIPVIKAIDPDNVIIVGTPTWSQDVDIAAKKPLKYENLMYALHFYADSHKEKIREKMREAIANGLPIFVTEFGICDASGNGAANLEETNIWLKELIENSISFIMWNLSNKAETSSMISEKCSKVSGFTDEDLTETGRCIKVFANM